MSFVMILPRQGEVAPKATEGEDTMPPGLMPTAALPLRQLRCHLPLAGEDRGVL